MPPRVTVPADSGANTLAGLAAHFGSARAAARALGIGRGTVDGIIGGRHGMGEKTRAAVETLLNDRSKMTSAEAKQAKDLGRTIAYSSAGQNDRRRAETNRLRRYDDVNKRKEVSFFVQRQKELAGAGGGGGGGGGGGAGGAGGPSTDSSDEEWWSEYGSWVEEVEMWAVEYEGDLPDVEDLPF
jgi:hypothetical protein